MFMPDFYARFARFLCPIYSTPLTSVAYRTRYFTFNMKPLAPGPLAPACPLAPGPLAPGPLPPWPSGPLALRPLDRWPPPEHMCSSLLGLGGTHVQQCSECRISRPPAPSPPASGPRLLAPMTLGGTHVQQSFRSSGTHVQQCSECRISRICVPHSRSFKRNSFAASYEHHAGLQPANLVTNSLRSCSRVL